MSPELAELLQTIPTEDRQGWVFRPLTKGGEPLGRSRHNVGPRVSEIGKKAGMQDRPQAVCDLARLAA